MNSYRSSTPRAAFGLIAAAMTAITFGALVAVPATINSFDAAVFTLAAAKPIAAAPIEVAISPARIEVTAVREPNVAWATNDAARPNCKPEG